MKTKILIKDLKVSCILGVGKQERSKPQEVTITVVLTVNANKASVSDDVSDIVNYRELYTALVDGIAKTSFHLLEALCNYVADICLQNPVVESVKVTITKPNRLEKAAGVVVEMEKDHE